MNIMSSFNQKLSYLPAVHTVLYTRHAKSCPSQEVWTKKKKMTCLITQGMICVMT